MTMNWSRHVDPNWDALSANSQTKRRKRSRQRTFRHLQEVYLARIVLNELDLFHVSPAMRHYLERVDALLECQLEFLSIHKGRQFIDEWQDFVSTNPVKPTPSQLPLLASKENDTEAA